MSTAGDAMRRLFERVGRYGRETCQPTIANKGGHNQEPSQIVERPPSPARFRPHPDGVGFTIDGGRMVGQPTRPGEQASGEFIGLRGGHALMLVKGWARRRGYTNTEIDQFVHVDELLDYIASTCREGR